MTGSFLVDTNILVYSYDRSESGKQAKAIALLERLGMEGRGVVTTQVLGEFFRTVTRKLPRPLPVADACRRVEKYVHSWTVLPVTPQIVLESALGVARYGLEFWDAQIWATAKLNQISVLLSEDFSHLRSLDGVRFINPFVYDIWESGGTRSAH